MYKKERKDYDEENDMLFMDIIQKIKRNDFFFPQQNVGANSKIWA